MKVTNFVPNDNAECIRKNRKENRYTESYVLVDIIDGRLDVPVEVRFYATEAKTYCCIWYRDHKNDIYSYGGGVAGGYGYNKKNAAFANAIKSLGFTFDEPHGVEGAFPEYTLRAIAKYLNLRTTEAINTHG